MVSINLHLVNNVQQRTTTYDNVQQCTTTYDNVQQRTTTYDNVQLNYGFGLGFLQVQTHFSFMVCKIRGNGVYFFHGKE